jgi:hypothetical protein
VIGTTGRRLHKLCQFPGTNMANFLEAADSSRLVHQQVTGSRFGFLPRYLEIGIYEIEDRSPKNPSQTAAWLYQMENKNGFERLLEPILPLHSGNSIRALAWPLMSDSIPAAVAATAAVPRY